MVVLALAGAGFLVAPQPRARSDGGERTFQIEASRYAYTPPVIRVEPGERVNIELVATDVVHGLYIDGYGVSVTAEPGQTQRLSFVADRAGSFRFRCSVACGPLHPFMVGKLKVGRNVLLWRAVGLAFAAGAAALLVTVPRPR